MGVPRKASQFLWRTTLADDATLCRLLAAIGRGEADRLAELYDLTSPTRGSAGPLRRPLRVEAV